MMALLLLLLLQGAAEPSAGISGRVVDAGTLHRDPLFLARVELTQDSGEPLVVRTDADGRFTFPNVGRGRHRLSVTCDGFLRKSSTVTITAGMPLNDVIFALDAAPTVVGHVRDSNNVPISNILVEALRVVYGPRGDRTVVTAVSALSDDRGEYHLYWLDPGEYYIRASSLPDKPGFALPGNPPLDSAGPRYAPTYYAGSRDPKEATSLRVRVGSNMNGLDFKLLTANLIGIMGNISIEATGEHIATRISVSPAGASASSQKYQGQSSLPDGAYGVGGMPPGTYVVSAAYSVGGQLLRVQRKVTLKGIELSIMLQMSPGQNIDGDIAAESGPALELRSVHVALDSVDPDLISPPVAAVAANGHFVSTRVDPGDYAIRLINLPGDTYIKSAKSGNTDILSKPLRVNLTPIEPINIVLGLDGSRIDGMVLDTFNQPFADADVVLVPDSARRNSPDQFRVTSSDDTGHFLLRGIPPGDYKLFAWQRVEPNAYMSPIFMEGYEPLGVSMTVPASSTGTTSVRLIPMD